MGEMSIFRFMYMQVVMNGINLEYFDFSAESMHHLQNMVRAFLDEHVENAEFTSVDNMIVFKEKQGTGPIALGFDCDKVSFLMEESSDYSIAEGGGTASQMIKLTIDFFRVMYDEHMELVKKIEQMKEEAKKQEIDEESSDEDDWI
jgi:hypothetical protein